LQLALTRSTQLEWSPQWDEAADAWRAALAHAAAGASPSVAAFFDKLLSRLGVRFAALPADAPPTLPLAVFAQCTFLRALLSLSLPVAHAQRPAVAAPATLQWTTRLSSGAAKAMLIGVTSLALDALLRLGHARAAAQLLLAAPAALVPLGEGVGLAALWQRLASALADAPSPQHREVAAIARAQLASVVGAPAAAAAVSTAVAEPAAVAGAAGRLWLEERFEECERELVSERLRAIECVRACVLALTRPCCGRPHSPPSMRCGCAALRRCGVAMAAVC
jgi:hypothetical protein